jgi:hypothetical protein
MGFPNQGEIYLAALVASQNCKDQKRDWSGCKLGPISGSQILEPPVLHVEKVQACNQPPIGTKTKIDPWEPKLEPEPFSAHATSKPFELHWHPQNQAHFTQDTMEIEV